MKKSISLLILIFLISSQSTIMAQKGKMIMKFEFNEKTEKTVINQTVSILQNRVNYYSNNKTKFSFDSTTRIITLKIDNESDSTTYKKIMQTQGKLEIVETFMNTEQITYFEKINNSLKTSNDSLTSEGNPLFSIFIPNVNPEGALNLGPIIGYSYGKDTSQVNSIFRLDTVISIIPNDVTYKWCEAYSDEDMFSLIAIKLPIHYTAITNEMIEEAIVRKNENTYNINLHFYKSYHDLWAKMTKDNIGKSLAIMIDGKVYNFPTVQSEIIGGNALISGYFTFEESMLLVGILKYGDIKTDLKLKKITIQK